MNNYQAEHRALMEENDLLRGALSKIAFARPVGATPKKVDGALIERIEAIALTALGKATKKVRA